jgi:hypothetical protein
MTECPQCKRAIDDRNKRHLEGCERCIIYYTVEPKETKSESRYVVL